MLYWRDWNTSRQKRKEEKRKGEEWKREVAFPVGREGQEKGECSEAMLEAMTLIVYIGG